jgi:antitoxin MazE
MKTRLIRIGNSKGVRIPKALIEQSGLRDEVEIVLKGDSLLIRRASTPREGWAEAFAEMSQRGDDALIDDTIATEFDRMEWKW